MRATRALTLTFLGTRGEINVHSRRHRRHSSLLIQCDAARIMVDCGADWLGRLERVAPTAVVLTHAHSDHAAGLAAGAPCPVYATGETWALIHRFPIRDRRQLPLKKSIMIDGARFTAIPVEHSIRAPAVGYRVSAQNRRFFYLPDVAAPPMPRAFFGGSTSILAMGRPSSAQWCAKEMAGLSATRLSLSNSAGANRPLFATPCSPIADRQSCVATP